MPGKLSVKAAVLLSGSYYTLWVLVFFHIAVITVSNYLVQLPFQLFGFHITWGAFSFPLVYVATDLTVRIYGAPLARQIIARVMVPALLISYGISVLFSQGEYQGIQQLLVPDLLVARIAFASFSAYLAGQLLDILVFNRLRQLNTWWIAPLASTVLGNALDTFVFFAMAFIHSSNPFMATHWTEIALVDYGFKLLASILMMLPLYGLLLSYLQRMITVMPVEKRAVGKC